MAAAQRDVYTVSRLNREARMLLEQRLPPLWIEGEISNLSMPSSGHWYFSLKDAQAQVRCCMFRQRNMLSEFKPRDGVHVLGRARVSLYEPRGEYQLILDHLEDAGEGALRRQFEVLKARLQREGLFETARKKPLPALARRIGVVTSPSGAAIRDILNVLRRRFPAAAVLIYPVQVQGSFAASQITGAIRYASERAECDLLIVARGGGSLEDLWPFNDERVARALAACPIPTITGIGHEVDFTIADFVADVRAPTPSGAAELAVPDGQEWLERFEALLRRVGAALRRRLQDRKSAWKWLSGRLAQAHPGVRLTQTVQRLDAFEQRLRLAMRRQIASGHARLESQRLHLRRLSPLARIGSAQHRRTQLQSRLAAAMQNRISRTRAQFDVTVRALNAVSPLATLERGYAIVKLLPGGELVRSAQQVKAGDHIQARLMRGSLRALVEESDE